MVRNDPPGGEEEEGREELKKTMDRKLEYAAM